MDAAQQARSLVTWSTPNSAHTAPVGACPGPISTGNAALHIPSVQPAPRAAVSVPVSVTQAQQSMVHSSGHQVRANVSHSASNAARIATRVQVPLPQAGQVGAPPAAHAPPSFAPRAPPRSVPRHVPPPMESAAAFGPPPGHQPWTQIKRVEIQTLAREKLKYEEWKAAFIACVDSSPATPVYKFLQMKQFLSGEALQAVANFGYTQRGYEAAKGRLDKKFGGERRQVARYVEELERVGSLSGSKAAEL